MRHIFIINPAAGLIDKTEQIRSELAKRDDIESIVFNTEEALHETKLMKEMLDIFDDEPVRICICGGSGTLSNAIDAVEIEDMEHVEIGFYPCGLTNDFLKNFGDHGRDFDNLNAIIDGKTKYVDFMRCIVDGDEKNVKVNNLDHKVRIIGFNHDTLASDSNKTAGITFEFAELFTIKDGSRYLRYTIDWGIDNYYFPNQHINGFCNGDVYDRLPDGLQKVIKNVFKDTTVKQSNEFVLEDYPTKLFPLSYEEMTEAPNKMMGNEGFIYQYYKENDLDECRKKHASHQENYAGYWLRSFPPGSGVLAGACEDDGSPNHLVPIIFGGIERSVAPAFCV